MKLNILFAFYFIYVNTYDFLDVTKYGYEQYQYVVVNGHVLLNMPPTNGQQPEKRYEILEQFLKLYKRPFTMLDIGAAQGYHSLRAAWDYPDSVFVMIEGNNDTYKLAGDQLLSICKCNNKLNNIVHLNKKVIVDDLIHMGKCEHFDVVLAFNILHWLENRWREAIEALLTLGDNILIETPPSEESNKCKEIIQYLERLGAYKVAEVPRHVNNKASPMYLLKSDKSKNLTWSTWLHQKGISYEIISDLYEKKLLKSDGCEKVVTDWCPGINLITFKMYQGAYPLVDILKKEVERLKDEVHNDWMPNNFIVQGSKLRMIDYSSSYFVDAPTKPETYNKFTSMLHFLDAKNSEEAKNLFSEVALASRICVSKTRRFFGNQN